MLDLEKDIPRTDDQQTNQEMTFPSHPSFPVGSAARMHDVGHWHEEQPRRHLDLLAQHGMAIA